ncbi:MAG TPA: hypothetical protein VIM30_13955 [Candidatus Limnocylindrales bacterium]|jgi:hypothetical protein
MSVLVDSSPVRAHLQSVQARRRIADALLGVTLDVVEPFACDYLSSADYLRLVTLVEAPIQAATEEALTTIERELMLLAKGDPDINRRLQRAQRTRP